MASTHRTFGTSKSNRNKIVISQEIEAAWAGVLSETELDDIEALKKEGWRRISEVFPEGNASTPAFERLRRSGKIDILRVRGIAPDGTVRKQVLLRPKALSAIPDKKKR